MVISIGIDIVEVYRIERALARTPRFAERVFTEQERAFCESKGKAAGQSYAARFAAKEAFLKALKTGWRGKIGWHDIEVIVDADGAPTLNITGEAKRLLGELRVARPHLSIAHTARYAIANVILESGGN